MANPRAVFFNPSLTLLLQTSHSNAAPARFIDSVVEHLIAAMRLASPAAAPALPQVTSFAQLAFAQLALWVTVVVSAKLAAGAQSTFWIWGLTTFAAQVYLWLGAVVLLCWRYTGLQHAPVAVTLLTYAAAPVMLLASSSVLVADTLAITTSEAQRSLLSHAVMLWLTVTFYRLCRLSPERRRLQAFAASLLYCAVLLGIVTKMPSSEIFYVAQEPQHRLDIESIYYRQPALVEQQLDDLSAERPRSIDMYFVGLGPFAAQDVFMRETLGAQHIVEQQLGLQGRSLSLLNNRQTLTQLPLANLPNLRHTLRGLGERIDRDNDIVFVFLTSHGSQGGTLAAEFEAIGPNDLAAHEIRRALDDARILWRVVVISACYSGSFIERLRSPNTLVITAAAADRASFGCRHENEWTYFGQAFFAEALLQTRDLVAAFVLAKAVIEAREGDEDKVASLPQMALGEHIAAHLQRWLANSVIQDRQ